MEQTKQQLSKSDGKSPANDSQLEADSDSDKVIAQQQKKSSSSCSSLSVTANSAQASTKQQAAKSRLNEAESAEKFVHFLWSIYAIIVIYFLFNNQLFLGARTV